MPEDLPTPKKVWNSLKKKIKIVWRKNKVFDFFLSYCFYWNWMIYLFK
jgi:hypothetical protein